MMKDTRLITLLKTVHYKHFNWISPQISEQLFSGTPLEGCYSFTKSMQGAWHFLFYYRGPYIRRYMKEASNWNEYKENTLRIGFQFHSLKLSRKSWLTLSFNILGGLCKERHPKETADNFQRRALWRKIMETLKTSIFIFTS